MLGQAVRRFTTSAVRASHYTEGPGQNLPFSVENKWLKWQCVQRSETSTFIQQSCLRFEEWESLIVFVNK
ncbi:hypothetical protein UPYG_G00189070 [Umbra pygmaea]|uniref:Cytochrome c oxidase subunit 7C, mitochondrial n=1 Tax=Umbra pygmaea TaxID=75934 RepID=A0ABD0WSR6_UMBPY